MLKAVLSVWEKIPMAMPFDLLEEMLGSDHQRDQQHAIRILELMVQCGFFRNCQSRIIKEYLVKLLYQEDRRAVSRLCAQLCGSILTAHPELEDFAEQVAEAVKKLQNRHDKEDVFVDVLYSLAQSNSAILSKFARANLDLLKNLHGTLKVISRLAEF